ncbi:Glycosyltransferase, catalytic subunit of cellulose synthase and poly-beta-1,6-N-acetylglucosamine synthase [Catalinimonas alkaloidigena]|uniref:Glycosyltransferase, catalytic subunit of cellulose synthase and poly-beta-1,6-N-acetylglucosamine synthase n=1 Tax=Catalinimonas alkaloidigena TaxID=1075417 RepID=A0A1G8WGD1_9BACT|nr:glycosyltransferase [Catalinimonas alkaloidigena]SDJ77399.1 Glycosyltransferase, catalytic subunit of cellulose synthase and poly-beta-1,6-N-acetylglucosamine synthase [Catalinimonas alkaloidigena]
MTALVFGVLALYVALTLLLYYHWRQIPERPPTAQAPPTTRLSVIIPVRNEADNIVALLQDLDRQTYPHFEVVVMDDASNDGTGELVRRFAQHARYALHCHRLAPLDGVVAYKKRALAEGISRSIGTLVVTTDGDCRVGPNWLRAIATAYEAERPALISAPVTFLGAKTLFEQMQVIEFASLVGAGGASMQAGAPNMCNGANLAYERAAFERVGGFAGTDHLASGDDELLMHKIARATQNRLLFLKTPAAVVQTRPHARLQEFVQQRRRWASKWQTYRDVRPRLLAVFIFSVHLLMLGSLGAAFAGAMDWATVGLAWGIKAAVEALYLHRVVRDLGKPFRWFVFLGLQLAYSPYVVLFGVLGNLQKTYRWKGRFVR